MPTVKKLIVPSSGEVRREAVQTIVRRMGITKAAIFVRENMSMREDYQNIKDELFGEKSVKQLYKEIKKR